MYNTSDIRKNLKIEIDGEPYLVVDFQFVKPGKGIAFTRTRLKNMITGAVLEKTFKSGEKLEPARLEEHSMQYLYRDGGLFHFMNNETYEQLAIDAGKIGEAANFLMENVDVGVLFYKGGPVNIDLPNFVELEVTRTEPGVKGDTATGATKEAVVSTGAKIQVPLFINEGEWVVVDTRSGQYVERAKR
jgi:elongation factor P